MYPSAPLSNNSWTSSSALLPHSVGVSALALEDGLDLLIYMSVSPGDMRERARSTRPWHVAVMRKSIEKKTELKKKR